MKRRVIGSSGFDPGFPVRNSQFPAMRPVTDGVMKLATVVIWVLILFNIIPEGFDYGVVDSLVMHTQGSWTSRAVWLTLMGVSGLMLVRHASEFRQLLRWIGPFVLCLLALAAASVLWSIDSGLTTRRLVRLVAIWSCALAFVVTGWHYFRFQTVVRPVLTLVLIGSLIAGVTIPEIAIHGPTEGTIAGAWRGLTTQKNSLGGLASIALIFWVHAWLAKQASPVALFLGLTATVACLVLSRSSTSILAAGVAIVLLLLLLNFRGEARRAAPTILLIFAGMIVVYSAAVQNLIPGSQQLLSPIAALTGKDLTFTGRLAVWDLMREHISLRPILGCGFGAYWAGPVPGSASFQHLIQLYFYPSQGHNGYLDVMNELGGVGLLLLLGYIVMFFLRARRLLGSNPAQGALYLALLSQQLICNLSESRWWNVLSVDFVIMAIATAALARDGLEAWRNRAMERPPSHFSRQPDAVVSGD